MILPGISWASSGVGGALGGIWIGAFVGGKGLGRGCSGGFGVTGLIGWALAELGLHNKYKSSIKPKQGETAL